MGVALEILRRRLGKGVPIKIVHTDQPGNDFASLFRLLDENPASYLRMDENAFAFAAGRSFYRQVCPARSVLLGWSSFAAQWLSRVPVDEPGHIYPAMTQTGIRQKFQEQSARDWLLFLSLRGEELRKGGRLVVLVPGASNDGRTGGEGAMAAAQATLEAMVGAGVLRPHELVRMIVPVVLPTTTQSLAPFEAGLVDGLAVVETHFTVPPDPAWEAFQEDGDTAALADAYVRFFQATWLPSLRRGLDPDRPATELRAFDDGFEADLRSRYLASPSPLCRFPVYAMTIQKLD
jgi:hypothetical protein